MNNLATHMEEQVLTAVVDAGLRRAQRRKKVEKVLVLMLAVVCLVLAIVFTTARLWN